MPSIGEQGWGELVSNNFEILDTNLNDLQTQITTNLNNLQDQINAIDTNIDTINTNIGNGTRILSISSPTIVTNITSENFINFASYDGNNVYFARFYGNTTFSSIPQPPHSCRLMIISVRGNLTINGSINTYPTTLQSETPPNSSSTNTYTNNISFSGFSTCTLNYTINANNSQLTMDYNDYLNFINNTYNLKYLLSIPHAIASGGWKSAGTAGTASNTCNGGGGGSNYPGGTGCIFGQYAGGNDSGYGYGSDASNKYRCGLVFVVNGNITITGTITQNGGNGVYINGDNPDHNIGGYGGGGGGGGGGGRNYRGAGGGGAPVFIYYTGTYTNNGTINTAGGSGFSSGGAGGIKTTKITL